MKIGNLLSCIHANCRAILVLAAFLFLCPYAQAHKVRRTYGRAPEPVVVMAAPAAVPAPAVLVLPAAIAGGAAGLAAGYLLEHGGAGDDVRGERERLRAEVARLREHIQQLENDLQILVHAYEGKLDQEQAVVEQRDAALIIAERYQNRVEGLIALRAQLQAQVDELVGGEHE